MRFPIRLLLLSLLLFVSGWVVLTLTSRADSPDDMTSATQRWQAMIETSLDAPIPDPARTAPLTTLAPIPVARGTFLVWQVSNGGRWDLNYTRPADGTSQALARTSNLSEVYPAIKPATTTLAYAAYRTNTEADLYMLSIENPTPIQLTDAPGIDTFPTWSPNGEFLYFVSTRDGNPEIYRMKADGSEESRLTNDAATDTYLTITPDGRFLTWVRVVNATQGVVMRYDISNGTLSQFTQPTNYLGRMVWESFGTTLFASCEMTLDIWFDLCAVSSAGGTMQHEKTAPQRIDYLPSGNIPGTSNLLVTTYHYDGQGVTQISTDQYKRTLIGSGGDVTPFIENNGRFNANATVGKTDLIAPITQFNPSLFERFVPNTGLTKPQLYTVNATDNNAGVATFELQVRPEGGAWQSLGIQRMFNNNQFYAAPLVSLNLESGESADVAVLAMDAVGNKEAPSPNNTARFTVYLYQERGFAHDTRNVPLRNATLESPVIIYQQDDPNGGDGFTLAFVSEIEPLRFIDPDYTPSLLYDTYGDAPYFEHAFLSTPAINMNPGFEFGLEGYTVTNGEFFPYSWESHTGNGAVRLSANGTLSFVVPLSDTLNNATLSMFYGYSTPNVTISNAITTTTFTFPNDDLNYRHAWLDLTPWQGLPTTITVASDPNAPLRLDDITVAEWNTPIVETITPTIIPISYQDVSVIIRGENLIPPLTATVGGVDVTPVLVDAQTVEVPIPNNLSLGRTTLLVRNRAGLPIVAQLQIGNALFVPLVQH